MDQTKLYELKERAKSALGITQIQLNRKAKNNAASADNSVKIDSMKNKNKINKFKIIKKWI